jgi:hypothetical protein
MMIFKVLLNLKNVVIDQQRGKQCAEMNQRKAEGFTRQFVRVIAPQSEGITDETQA